MAHKRFCVQDFVCIASLNGCNTVMWKIQVFCSHFKDGKIKKSEILVIALGPASTLGCSQVHGLGKGDRV